MATGLIACSDMQTRSQPLQAEVVSADAVTQSPSDTISAAMPGSWSAILGPTSAPEGWQVTPCDNPVLLCVYRGDALIGSVELLAQPVAGSEFEAMLAESGGEPVEALQAWAVSHYEVIGRDRLLGDSAIQFSSAPPEAVTVGNLPGIRYGFTTTHANGVLIDRAIGYATTDGTTLYVIVTGVISQDPSGSFSSNEDAQQFEPYLAAIVQGLNF